MGNKDGEARHSGERSCSRPELHVALNHFFEMYHMHRFDLENIDHSHQAMINYVLVIPVSSLSAFFVSKQAAYAHFLWTTFFNFLELGHFELAPLPLHWSC